MRVKNPYFLGDFALFRMIPEKLPQIKGNYLQYVYMALNGINTGLFQGFIA